MQWPETRYANIVIGRSQYINKPFRVSIRVCCSLCARIISIVAKRNSENNVKFVNVHNEINQPPQATPCGYHLIWVKIHDSYPVKMSGVGHIPIPAARDISHIFSPAYSRTDSRRSLRQKSMAYSCMVDNRTNRTIRSDEILLPSADVFGEDFGRTPTMASKGPQGRCRNGSPTCRRWSNAGKIGRRGRPAVALRPIRFYTQLITSRHALGVRLARSVIGVSLDLRPGSVDAGGAFSIVSRRHAGAYLTRRSGRVLHDLIIDLSRGFGTHAIATNSVGMDSCRRQNTDRSCGKCKSFRKFHY
jgi:hypothetical protein